jgi:hypothetical protein
MPAFASVRAHMAPFSVSPSFDFDRISSFLPPVLMSQWFGPTRLIITFQLDGPGAFSQDEIDNIAVRGRDGRVSSLNLPRKCILVANHQVRP